MTNISLHLWNVSDLQLRTNNNCEGQEEVYFHHQVIQMLVGATGRSKTKKTNCVQRRIDILVDRYKNDEINLEEYLEDLSFVVG
ncbi:unnamed protein product [Didymodactylos carnosus]|uniref:Uncharacterized protein n=1 Tax=Didymodactylos carnosus TaxID=1234261 RepID=A0A8S2IZT1_9BILA|nr:unnamed protein product [Didymodactylos carnosus]CAF3780096.1 unnamed protein product [Didymodactylos carnosus]